MPRAAKLNEFMFFSSVRVRRLVPGRRTETFASTRSEPFSISASETPSSTIVCRSSWRKRFASSAERRSGCGHDLDERRAAAVEVDERALARRGCGRSAPPTCTVFAASSSRCARTIPISRSPSGAGQRRSAARRRAARRTARSGSPSAGRDRSSSCGGTRRGRDLAAEREAEQDRRLDRGPVRHRQRAGMGEADRARLRVRRVAEAASRQRQNIFVRVFRCTWISRPTTVSQLIGSRSGTTSKPSARSSAWPARKSRFSENWRPDQLQADGQPVREAARDREAGQPGQVRGDREQVGQRTSRAGRPPSRRAGTRPSARSALSEHVEAARTPRRARRAITVRTLCAWP